MTAGLATLLIALLVLRQLIVLGAIRRSLRYLRDPPPTRPAGSSGLRLHIVVPVLREAEHLDEAVAHFVAMLDGHDGRVIVVTTAREVAEASAHRGAHDTIETARGLAGGRVTHLHLEDATGVKSDQVNFAAVRCADESADRTFLIVYDADSRPPLDSLGQFAAAVRQHGDANVFHQSSRFALAQDHRSPRPRLVAGGGVLRANRFVLAYELPRLLNRLGPPTRIKRRLASAVYTHVTGHGLCIRLSFLRRFPLPPRTPLEDMHYSYQLCAAGEPMIPVPSLDLATVPGSVSVQMRQLARWFLGPGRFVRYWRRAAPRHDVHALALTVSAAGIAGAWLSCTVLPILLLLAAVVLPASAAAVVVLLIAVMSAQLIIVDLAMSPDTSVPRRTARIVGFPVACTLFGVAGFWGTTLLVRSGRSLGKTERY